MNNIVMVMSLQVTGFQGDGGVYMQLTYSGPDTGNTAALIRSTDSAIPQLSSDDRSAGFTMQVCCVFLAELNFMFC